MSDAPKTSVGHATLPEREFDSLYASFGVLDYAGLDIPKLSDDEEAIFTMPLDCKQLIFIDGDVNKGKTPDLLRLCGMDKMEAISFIHSWVDRVIGLATQRLPVDVTENFVFQDLVARANRIKIILWRCWNADDLDRKKNRLNPMERVEFMHLPAAMAALDNVQILLSHGDPSHTAAEVNLNQMFPDQIKLVIEALDRIIAGLHSCFSQDSLSEFHDLAQQKVFYYRALQQAYRSGELKAWAAADALSAGGSLSTPVPELRIPWLYKAPSLADRQAAAARQDTSAIGDATSEVREELTDAGVNVES